MRVKLILFILLGCLQVAQAQYFVKNRINIGKNPDNINYGSETTNPSSTGWETILSISDSNMWSEDVELPFNFHFNNSKVNYFKVNKAGVLTFDTISNDSIPVQNLMLPSVFIPKNSISILGSSQRIENSAYYYRLFEVNNKKLLFINYRKSLSSSTNFTRWNIVLEEFSNKIYLVDYSSQGPVNLSLGLQFDQNNALMVDGSPNVNSYARKSSLPDDNSYYEFIPGSQPAADMATRKISIPPISPKTAVPIKATVQTFGWQNVTGFTANYQINNGPVVSAPMGGFNLATQDTLQITHPTLWTPTDTGLKQITFFITNINGLPDQINDDDTAKAQTRVVADFVPRLPLIERFTSATCANCKQVNEDFYNYIGNQKNDWAVVNYPYRLPNEGDPYTPRITYTSKNITSQTKLQIPIDVLNGNLVFKADSLNYPNLMPIYKNNYSFVDLNSSFWIDVEAKTVHIHVKSKWLHGINQHFRYAVVVKEKTTKNNVMTNGETIFYDVYKASNMSEDINEINIKNPIKNQIDSFYIPIVFNGNYRLPENGNSNEIIDFDTEHSVEDFNNLEVVVWVFDASSKEVYQACNATKTVGIEQVNQQEFVFLVYPNPAQSMVLITLPKLDGYSNLSITNAFGQQMFQKEKVNQSSLVVDLKNLMPGLYFITLENEDKKQLKKLVIIE